MEQLVNEMEAYSKLINLSHSGANVIFTSLGHLAPYFIDANDEKNVFFLNYDLFDEFKEISSFDTLSHCAITYMQTLAQPVGNQFITIQFNILKVILMRKTKEYFRATIINPAILIQQLTYPIEHLLKIHFRFLIMYLKLTQPEEMTCIDYVPFSSEVIRRSTENWEENKIIAFNMLDN